ncbi:MAG: DISARM system SNF2-like helicase DrmD [Polyangiaceae bacterium]
MTTVASNELEVGSLVRARQRTWVVEAVRGAEGAASVVDLACVDDDASGDRLSVIWSAEVDARLVPPGRSLIKEGVTPDDPRLFAAYLNALRWGCVTSTDPGLFQAPLRAGIIPKSYQLEPLRKALALPRVNLFIADDVGLGKTIEAGLILQELLLRQRVQRVVISCPASVLLQWRDELAQRFGQTFVVMDRAYVQARRRERGFGVNAWTTHRAFLISHALLRDEDYLVGLREWLGTFCPGSLLILDEAHVAAPASESRYAIDTQITRAVRDVAKRFEHRLFLSATPHNGHSNSFASLMEILDPQRFNRGVPVKSAAALKPVMVRRLKGELRPHLGSEIPERKTIQIDLKNLPKDTPELVLAEKLAAYTDILERKLAGAGNRTKSLGKLVTIGLQKRLLSSIEAFATTLAVHRKNAAKTIMASMPKGSDPPMALSLFDEDDDEDRTDDERSEIESAEVARATRAGATAEDDARAKKLLDEMSALAESARDRPDAKMRALLDWVRKNQCPDLGAKHAKWLPKRVLIFTEYADTKEYLGHQFEAALQNTDRAEDRVRVIHGGMDEEDREQIKQAFNDPASHVRILIATDAAREGVNLQACCSDLFHFDLPWNPGRIEQRNGRIDRTLQPEPEVRCHYFVYAERPEDRVLEALVTKTVLIHRELGSLSQVIEQRITRTLRGGIQRSQAAELVSAIATADAVAKDERSQIVAEELEPARNKEVVKELDELTKLDQKSRDHLQLTSIRLRDVVNLGLSLAGASPLVPTSKSGEFSVPDVDKLAARDPTWREIVDTLRPPRPRKMPDWEWRSTCPARAVSFEPSTTLASESVQLHLNHRLTQKALAQFRAQGFAEDRLSRVTVVFDPTHARKRVLVLGRLSLYGAGASRLHEEVLAHAAYWVEGDDRTRLEPFATQEADQKALESLLSVLDRPEHPKVPKHIVDLVMKTATADEAALWDKLRDRAHMRIIFAEERLRMRSVAESTEMDRILKAQKANIEKELAKRGKGAGAKEAMQLALPWLPEEKSQKEQYDADSKVLEKRLVTLEDELRDEPSRIKELYDVKHHRLERVGLVYLWPTTS